MIVRPAIADDAKAVAEIMNPVIRDTTISFKPAELSVEEIADLIAAAPAYFVAEDGGRIVGFASYDQFRKGAGYARTMENTIALAPDARAKGAGRALMTALFEAGRTQGVGSIWAGVSGENPAGKAFHAALGFQEVAVLEKVGFKFGRWLDLILMRKWLDPEGDAGKRTD